MNPISLLQKYCDPKSEKYQVLIIHSQKVAEKALKIAKKFPDKNPDLNFIYEAAMLHDIGTCVVGDKPYITHGLLGKEILDKEGLPKHGLVCERHIGVGLTQENVIQNNLPLPKKDMIPLSLEEQIITFADKFYSKNQEYLTKEKSKAQIEKELTSYGPEKVKIFNKWYQLFTG